MKTVQRKRGFTLIELLVVIAVIAVLMGILMPALSRAREQGKAAGCMSNLKQWGLCFSMYLSENDNRFIPGQTQAGSWYAWMDLMAPYYKNETIFRCPTSRKKPVVDSYNTREIWSKVPEEMWRCYNETIDKEYYGSYGLNYWISTKGSGNNEDVWGTDLFKGSKSDVPLFADCAWIGAFPRDTDAPRTEEKQSTISGEMNRFVIDRHQKQIQIVFMDYAVKKVRLTDLWKLKWGRKFDIQNKYTHPDWDFPDWMVK